MIKHAKYLTFSQALENRTVFTAPIHRCIKEAISSVTTIHSNIELLLLSATPLDLVPVTFPKDRNSTMIQYTKM